jgi:PAS domain S-box-containing protein
MYELFDLNKGSFELTFSNISNMYHPEDRWRMDADVNATFADKEIDEFDNRILTPSGKTKWIHQKIRLIRDSENRPLALDGVLQDVTESKEKEQSLEESNERYRLIMKASSEALIDWDIVRDVTIWGDGFATIFGYDLRVYDNYLWSGNIHPDDREQVLKDLEHTLANPLKNVFYAAFRYLKANREVTYVQHRGLIVRDKNGKPLRAIGSVMDMTEIMERNIKIENHNKAFSEIAWIQSHKVRGPLTSLMGLLNILKTSPTDDISEDNLIEMIDIAANELDMIIHEIVEKSEKVVFDEQ